MILADLAPTDSGYRLLLLGHLLAVIVGFGSSFVWPFLGIEASKQRGAAAGTLSDFAMKYATLVTTYPIWAAGVFGGLLVATGPRGLDETWVGMAMGLFIVMVLFAALVHVPNLKKMNTLGHELMNLGGPAPGSQTAGASGPPPQAIEMEARGKAAARNGGILHLAFAVVLVLMVWQPGA
jgi:hypothetical protein